MREIEIVAIRTLLNLTRAPRQRVAIEQFSAKTTTSKEGRLPHKLRKRSKQSHKPLAIRRTEGSQMSSQ